MLSSIDIRRFGPWLLGLFLLAQAAGVMPLIGIHIQHAFENEQDIAADLSQSGKITHVHYHHSRHDGGQHEHSSADPYDQCCTLHNHLAGVVSIASTLTQRGFTASRVEARPRSLVGTDPGALERPPKLRLSI